MAPTIPMSKVARIISRAPERRLSDFGIRLLLLAEASSAWGRERVLLAMEEGGLFHERAWVVVA